MAETPVTPNEAPGLYSTSGQVLTQTAIDVANGNAAEAGETTIILVRNTGASAHTFTITSQPDEFTGRTGDVSESIAAGELRAFRVPKNGWADGSGNIIFGGNHAELVASVMTL
jgi:hypothetical protein